MAQHTAMLQLTRLAPRVCTLVLFILPLMMQLECFDILFIIHRLKDPVTSNEFSIHPFVQLSDRNTQSSSHLKLKHSLSKSTTEDHLFSTALELSSPNKSPLSLWPISIVSSGQTTNPTSWSTSSSTVPVVAWCESFRAGLHAILMNVYSIFQWK